MYRDDVNKRHTQASTYYAYKPLQFGVACLHGFTCNSHLMAIITKDKQENCKPPHLNAACLLKESSTMIIVIVLQYFCSFCAIPSSCIVIHHKTILYRYSGPKLVIHSSDSGVRMPGSHLEDLRTHRLYRHTLGCSKTQTHHPMRAK